MMKAFRIPVAWLAAAVAGAAAGSLPSRGQPVAQPVDPQSTHSSRVVVALQPVGRIEYDGQTLPVSSPSGEFIAAQSGRAPAWELVLGVGRQSVPAGVRIAVQRLERPSADGGSSHGKPAAPRLVPITPSTALPGGLLLGRGADDAGFLVESPRADGTRWIGRVHWLSGRLDWLAQADAVCAHATLAPSNPDQAPDQPRAPEALLAYVQRPVGAGAGFNRLVVRVRAGTGTSTIERLADAGETLAHPVFSADGRTIGVFVIGGGSLRLVALGLRFAGGGMNDAELVEVARLDLGPAPRPEDAPLESLHAAYQCVAAMQAPPVMPRVENASAAPAAAFAASLCVLSPRDGSVVLWDPVRDEVAGAMRGTFAAVPFHHHAGFGLLLAGPGLSGSAKPAARAAPGRAGNPGPGAPSGAVTYQPIMLTDEKPGAPQLGRGVEVVSGRMIPRATRQGSERGEPGVTLLLGEPKGGAGTQFDLVLLAPAEPE